MLREEEITRQLSKVFKNLRIPEYILSNIMQTLDTLHRDKINFHNAEFDKLTADKKMVTKMMDNLYFDKIKGRITESDYDRFYQTVKHQAIDVTIRLEQLQEAKDNYYLSAKCLLGLANRASELFTSSEVEEKRQVMKLVLSNERLKKCSMMFNRHLISS